MPFSVLFSVFGMGVALMGLQIRLSGQVRDQIRGVHGEIRGLKDRIDLMEERLGREIRGLRTCINGPVDSDQVSVEIKEVRGGGDVDQRSSLRRSGFGFSQAG